MIAIISIFLTNLGKYNEGELVGQWLKLPTTKTEIQKTLEEIEIDRCMYEEWFITDYETDINGINKILGEYENVDELNYLAERLSELQSYEIEIFEAILEIESSDDLKYLINLTYNLDKCNYHRGIRNYEDLGRYYAEEIDMLLMSDNIKMYFDYESYGRDIYINASGVFTANGYVDGFDSSDVVEYYDGGDL